MSTIWWAVNLCVYTGVWRCLTSNIGGSPLLFKQTLHIDCNEESLKFAIMKKVIMSFFFAILGLSSYAQDANGFATYNYYSPNIPPAGFSIPSAPTYACPQCNGKGVIICYKCEGSGITKCTGCGGSGFDYGNCPVCKGKGYNKSGNQMLYCSVCKGTGRKLCSSCNGSGNLGNCQECNGKGAIYCPGCKGTGKL